MGPPPNNCEQRISISLLHDPAKKIACRPGERLVFPVPEGISAVEAADRLLTDAGYSSLDEARHTLALPSGRWLCVELPSDDLPDPPIDLLRVAILLGMCGPSYYDNDRPPIWTEARLRRRLQLFAPGNFYAS